MKRSKKSKREDGMPDYFKGWHFVGVDCGRQMLIATRGGLRFYLSSIEGRPFTYLGKRYVFVDHTGEKKCTQTPRE